MNQKYCCGIHQVEFDGVYVFCIFLLLLKLLIRLDASRYNLFDDLKSMISN